MPEKKSGKKSQSAIAYLRDMVPEDRRWVVLAASLCALLITSVLVTTILDHMRSTGEPVQHQAATPVVATMVSLADFSDRIEAIGTAKANESVTISAQVTEVVGKLGFDDGETVEAGDILAELVGQEESAQLDEARADLEEAHKQYNRILELVRRGNASQANLDRQTGLRDAARARLDIVAARLSDRLIRAPFSGVLGMRLASPGTLLEPGDPIVTLDDISTIKLDFPIPEIYLASVAPDMVVRVRSAAYPEQTFTGRVTAVSPRIDPVTRSMNVRAEIANPDNLLKPGMLLSVVLITHPRQSLSVPESALLQLRDQHFLFRINAQDKAERRPVTIGLRVPGRVEILQGVEAGDKIVIDGIHRVRDGQTVNVVEIKPVTAPAPTRSY